MSILREKVGDVAAALSRIEAHLQAITTEVGHAQSAWKAYDGQAPLHLRRIDIGRLRTRHLGHLQALITERLRFLIGDDLPQFRPIEYAKDSLGVSGANEISAVQEAIDSLNARHRSFHQ